MTRRLAIVVLLLLILPAAVATGREKPAAGWGEKLQTLQGQFDQWQQELLGLNFKELTLDQHWLFSFNRERQMCLESMKDTNEQITAVEVLKGLKGKGPTPAQEELLLVDDLSRLSDHLQSLSDLVVFSFGTAPPSPNAGATAGKWQHQVVSLLSMVKAIQTPRALLRYDLYNRLNAMDQSEARGVRIAPSPQTAAPHGHISQSPARQKNSTLPGQIAGHIYRADTGAALADAIVTLSGSPSGKTQSQRTAADGSYHFADLAPGYYWLSVYRTDFAGQVYRTGQPGTFGSCPPSCISLSGGQKLEGIDLRLSVDPSITPMDEDGFRAVYPEKPLRLVFGPGRFSLDGKFLAIVAQEARGGPLRLWLYDMRSHNLTSVTDGPGEAPLDFGIQDLAWAGDDTLYLSGLLIRHRVGHQAYAAVSITGVAKEVAEIPPRIAATFQEGEALQPSSSIRVDDTSAFDEGAHNDQFVVLSQRLCDGCSNTLSARQRNGGAARFIGSIDRNFVFDADRSLVFYPKLAFYSTGSIVIFNLKTWQPREIAMPVVVDALLDQTHDGTGSLVAYVVQGSCEPDASSEEAESQLLAPDIIAHLRPERPPPFRVCFVKLP